MARHILRTYFLPIAYHRMEFIHSTPRRRVIISFMMYYMYIYLNNNTFEFIAFTISCIVVCTAVGRSTFGYLNETIIYFKYLL